MGRSESALVEGDEGCHGPDMPLNYLIGRRLGIAASYVICLGICISPLVTRLCLVFPLPRSLVLFQR
jgi:hypothetical protein